MVLSLTKKTSRVGSNFRGGRVYRGEGVVEEEKVIRKSSGAALDMFSIDRVVSKDVTTASRPTKGCGEKSYQVARNPTTWKES